MVLATLRLYKRIALQDIAADKPAGEDHDRPTHSNVGKAHATHHSEHNP